MTRPLHYQTALRHAEPRKRRTVQLLAERGPPVFGVPSDRQTPEIFQPRT
jgi:hypothetical protein